MTFSVSVLIYKTLQSKRSCVAVSPPQDCKKDPGCCYDKHETPARPLVVQIACNIYSATQ